MILCALAFAADMLTGKTETATDGVPKRRRRREAMVAVLCGFYGGYEVEGGLIMSRRSRFALICWKKNGCKSPCYIWFGEDDRSMEKEHSKDSCSMGLLGGRGM